MTSKTINETTVCKETDRVHLAITKRCNNNCLFCLQGHHPNENHRNLQEIQEEIDFAVSNGCQNKIILSGGEPTIHPDFLEIVKYAKEKGFKTVQAVSNGRMFSITSFTKKAVRAGLNEATLSIHGHTKEIHDELVNVKGAYEQVKKAAHNLKKHNIIISVDVGIFKQNYKHLPEIVNFIREDLELKGDIDLIGPTLRGNAQINMKKVMPPYELTEPYIKKALQICREKNIVCWVLRVPLKYMKGYEVYKQDNNKLAEKSLSIGKNVKKALPDCYGISCSFCRLNYACQSLIHKYPFINKNTNFPKKTDYGDYYHENINSQKIPNILINFNEIEQENKNRRIEETIDKINNICFEVNEFIIDCNCCKQFSFLEKIIIHILKTKNKNNHKKIIIKNPSFDEKISHFLSNLNDENKKKIYLKFDFATKDEKTNKILGLKQFNSKNLYKEIIDKKNIIFNMIITQQNINKIRKNIDSLIRKGIINFEISTFNPHQIIKREISWDTGMHIYDEYNLVPSLKEIEKKVKNILSKKTDNNINILIKDLPYCIFSNHFYQKNNHLFKIDSLFTELSIESFSKDKDFLFFNYIKSIFDSTLKERIKECDTCSYRKKCAGFYEMHLKLDKKYYVYQEP